MAHNDKTAHRQFAIEVRTIIVISLMMKIMSPLNFENIKLIGNVF